jgi:YfiH family protein
VTLVQDVTPSHGPPYLTFPTLAIPGLAHAVFTRRGGVSATPFDSLNVSTSVGDDPLAVERNRDLVAAALARARDSLVFAGLVHGTSVAIVASRTEGRPLQGGGRSIPGVDALLTADPEVTLVITAADCAPIFLVDPARRAIGLVHAGWRGIAAGVIPAAIAAMREAFGSNPSAIRAAIGPSLGPCCGEFSDPRRELPAWCAPYVNGRFVDLWAMAEAQLHEAGLCGDGIATARICTVCRRDLFFSHRGDRGHSGRFAAVLALERVERPTPAAEPADAGAR